jgi:hypothetical protein
MITTIRTCAVLLLTCSVVFAAPFGAGRSIVVGLKASEHISASAVNDDGSGVLALTSPRTSSSRLTIFKSDGTSSERKIADMRINHVTALSPTSLFVGGSAPGSGYSFRLLNVSPSDVTTVWDSTHLSIGKRDHMVVPSADGVLWAAVQPSRGKLVVMIGAFPKYEPSLTVEISPNRDVAKELHLDSEYASVLFVNSDAARPFVAVQWLGASYLIQQPASGPGSAIREVLATLHGPVTRTEWDAMSGMLWLKSRATWSAYDVSTLDAGGSRLSLEISPDLVGREPLDIIPLAAGRIGITTNRPNGDAKEMHVAVFNRAAARPSVAVVSSAAIPAYRHSVTSNRGHMMLGLPAGAMSKTVVVHTIDL